MIFLVHQMCQEEGFKFCFNNKNNEIWLSLNPRRRPPPPPARLRECVPGAAWDQNRWRIGVSTREFRSDTVHDSADPLTINFGPEGARGSDCSGYPPASTNLCIVFSLIPWYIRSSTRFFPGNQALSPDSPPLGQPAAVTNKSCCCFDLVFFSFSFFLSLFQVGPNRKQYRRVKALS